jgi:hypothetical protein
VRAPGNGDQGASALKPRPASAPRWASGARAFLLVIVALLVLGDGWVADLLDQLTISHFVLPAVVVVAFAGAGAVVAHHQPSNAVGWLLLGAAMFLALNGLASDYSVLAYRVHHATLTLGPLAVLLQPSWAPGIVCIAFSILLFPDGHLPPGRWRWGLCAFLALGALWLGGAYAIAINAIVDHSIHVDAGGNLVLIDHPTGGAAWWGYVQDVFFPALLLCALLWCARQLVSYRHARGEHRQQLKWLMIGAATCVLSGGLTLGASGSSWPAQAVNALATAGLAAFPVSICVGILKYRLYEIDRLISRTLSYAILSALLVGTFIGLIALTTNTLALSGRVGVAASTLAAAALFNPLRIRIQRLVDRRFNRARYDAEATVAAFSSRLRDAVELDTIREELLDVVNRAVQPTHASIWIKQ